MTIDAWQVGDRFAGVRVGPVAHGGHWVARHEGRVVFVRHALADELVTIEITGLAKRHAFADAVAVEEPSPHRVEPPCPIAAVCGGCDLQHVEVAHQRELKRQVVAEQLRRLAGLEWEGEVEAVEPDAFGWRTRMRYHRVDTPSRRNRWGMRAKGSHDVVPLPEQGCLIAAPGIELPPAVVGEEGDELLGVLSADGALWAEPGTDAVVRERAAGRAWGVRADGFWQVHPQAADTLVEAVMTGLQPQEGEVALDLYCGVGLFAGALVDAGAEVLGAEGSRDAVGMAEANVEDAQFEAGSVDRVLARTPGLVDLVVLDPPRAGAGRAVIEDVCDRDPRMIAYVACDPAALARDLAFAMECGYEVEGVRAFDLFPQTHHVECVALLVPAEG